MDSKKIKDAILNGDIAGLPVLVNEALSSGMDPKDILDNGLIAGMAIVGDKFKANEIFVPEVLIAAKAMQEGLSVLEPKLAETGVEPKGKVVIGTVRGDLHDIGKNLVVMMFKGAGFTVIDLGIDASPQAFIDKARSENASAIAMSALITTSMPAMKDTVSLVKSAGLSPKVKTIIGGAPVTQEYADEIGADGYAPDASSGVDKLKELLGL